MLARFVQPATEAVLIAMACLAPWALGSRGARPQLALAVGVLILAVLRALGGWRPGDGRALLSRPSLGLASLLLLALLQAAPVGEGVLRVLSPSAASLRAELLPKQPERVIGDAAAPVPLPTPRLTQNYEGTVQTAARVLALWIVFQSIMRLDAPDRALRRFGFALVANAFFLGFFTLIQRLSWNGKIYWTFPAVDPTSGPFWNHNALAATLNVGFGVLAGTLAAAAMRRGSRRGQMPDLLPFYVLGVIIVGVIASSSRMGLLSMGLIAGLAVFVQLRAKGLASAWGEIQTLGAGLVVIAAVLVGVLAAINDRGQFGERLAELNEARAYEGRLNIWSDCLRAWWSSPVWGTGLGSFPVAFRRFLSRDQPELFGFRVTFNHAESEYLEWLVEGGVVGLAAFLLIFWGAARLALVAWRSAATTERRAAVLGGSLAGMSLMIHSFTDFALHTPPVAIIGVALAGFLSRLGLGDGPSPAPPGRRPVAMIVSAVLALFFMAAGAVVVAVHYPFARCDALLASVGLTDLDRIVNNPQRPLPNRGPAKDEWDTDPGEMVQVVDRALAYRPDWAEGRLLLASLLVRLYERDSAAAIADSVEDAGLRTVYASPLWFRRRYYADPPERRKSADEVLAFEPVNQYLVPAALECLEARRSAMVLALPHTQLAGFDYLLVEGDSTATYLERALRLAGGQSTLYAVAADVAAASGDLDVATRCWRLMLTAQPESWERLADAAGAALPPDLVLEKVAVTARDAVLFAERLYPDADDADVSAKFYQAALKRLADDSTLPRAEKLDLEARARHALGDRTRARALLLDSVRAEPRDVDRRARLVDWLIEAGEVKEAHQQAKLGVSYHPKDRRSLQALDRALDALFKSPADSSPTLPLP